MVSSRVTSPESIEDIVHRLLELGIDLRHSTALITRPSSPAPVATATIATANHDDQSDGQAAGTNSQVAGANTPTTATALRRQVPADSQDFAQIIALLGSDQNHSTFGNGTPTPQNGMMASQIATAYAAATTSGLNSAPASGSTMVSIGDGADPGDSRSGTFMCNSCKAVNIIGGNTDFYYAITVGTRIGVIHTWHVTQPLIIGVRGACFRRYATQELANRAFREALFSGLVKIVDAGGALVRVVLPGDDY